MKRFFLQDVYVPGNALGMERQLADVVRPFVNHVLGEDAMRQLADKVKARQQEILSESKRLREVHVSLELNGANYWPFRFTIGNVNVSLRKVEGMEDTL